MPELAEVERARRLAERVTVGRRIEAVWCDDDPIVFEGCTPAEVVGALRGARVEAAHRRGKHLWLALDRRPWLLLHLGMTGNIHAPGEDPLRLASSPRGGDPAWPPRFAKIRLGLDDGGALAMTNKRRLGRIRLREDPLAEPPISRLGFDPLLGLPPAAALVPALARRRSPLKAVLLDQSFAAGVGNWLADEVCYQARLDPGRRASELTLAEVTRLHGALGEVVRQAVAVDADSRLFPAGWLFHRRWGRPTGAVTLDGHAIETTTIAGRSTAWVPAVQGGSFGG